VTFLDFGDRDFDSATVIEPTLPTRAFWENALAVAIDDLSNLVAPKEVVVCEGNLASPIARKNSALDATCYDTIFAAERPDTKFLSAGSSTDVAADRLGFVAGISALASGITVRRLIDRDDHGASDIAAFNGQGVQVLSRRHLESYLFDDEVLTQLCIDRGSPAIASDLLAAKATAMAKSAGRGNAVDDVKSANGEIYVAAKGLLSLAAVGNDARAFMRQTLAPLLKPGMTTYALLKKDIFGP
jgi:hypothetical protein